MTGANLRINLSPLLTSSDLLVWLVKLTNKKKRGKKSPQRGFSYTENFVTEFWKIDLDFLE